MCECHRCHKKFDWQYLLDKHLARKFPCKNRKDENSSDKDENSSDKDENSSDKDENSSDKVENSSIKCRFCCKLYSSEKYKNIHEETCKLKDDHVRCLEMKLNIDFEAVSPQHCRFCNTTFSKANIARHLIRCKAKQDYKEKLEKQIEYSKPVATTTNNITNNIDDHSTNITQYITVNPFGKENMEYITKAVILKLCNKANFRNEIIPRLVKQVHCNPEHPENHNLLITNLRAAHGTVYDGENYIAETSKDIIDKVMDNVTDHLTTAAYMDNDDGKFNPYERAITRLEEDIGDEDSKFKREQRTKVKRNIYNNQKILQKTRKAVESQS